LLPIFDATNKSRKEKEKKSKNTREYTLTKPRRLLKLMVKDQNGNGKN
jgi:hypothetical protein